ncbi:axoneme-associated protein mst101(1)-like [Drosophila madeirensis]|uniref:Axoneme-associated protein mst101(1)-like n=1 Tax=Drosophila madeirensis TaxID=30013 RepID=A0AAU9FXB0_DROMD
MSGKGSIKMCAVSPKSFWEFLRTFRRKHMDLTSIEAVTCATKAWGKLTGQQKCQFEHAAVKIQPKFLVQKSGAVAARRRRAAEKKKERTSRKRQDYSILDRVKKLFTGTAAHSTKGKCSLSTKRKRMCKSRSRSQLRGSCNANTMAKKRKCSVAKKKKCPMAGDEADKKSAKIEEPAPALNKKRSSKSKVKPQAHKKRSPRKKKACEEEPPKYTPPVPKSILKKTSKYCSEEF